MKVGSSSGRRRSARQDTQGDTFGEADTFCEASTPVSLAADQAGSEDVATEGTRQDELCTCLHLLYWGQRCCPQQGRRLALGHSRTVLLSGQKSTLSPPKSAQKAVQAPTLVTADDAVAATERTMERVTSSRVGVNIRDSHCQRCGKSLE